MRSTNEIQLMPMQELRHHIHTECKAHATIILAPTLHILVGITPQQIAQKAGIGYISWTHKATYLFHALQIGTQTTVTTEDLLINNSSNG